jgi:hypothetical protein
MSIGERRLRRREPLQAQFRLAQPQVQPEDPVPNHASANPSA